MISGGYEREDEWDIIRGQINQENPGDVWLGARRVDPDDEITWLHDGEVIPESHWVPWMQREGMSGCVYLQTLSALLVMDDICDTPRAFICEFSH